MRENKLEIIKSLEHTLSLTRYCAEGITIEYGYVDEGQAKLPTDYTYNDYAKRNFVVCDELIDTTEEREMVRITIGKQVKVKSIEADSGIAIINDVMKCIRG